MDMSIDFESLRMFHNRTDAQQSEDSNECIQESMMKIALIPPSRSRPAKNNATALTLYSRGELKARERKYRDAVILYTKALQDAYPYSLTAAFCYVGRSFALTQLGLYEEALTDMVEALELPMPLPKKVECLAIKKTIEMKLQLVRAKSHPMENDTPEILSYGESEEIPGASSAIEIAYDSRYGRKLVATRSIKLGDVLIIERPYMTYPKQEPCKRNPSTDKSGWNCDHCMKNTMAPISCDNCLRLYCSKECRTEAYEKYHEIECTVIMPGDANTAILRLLLIMTKQGADLDNVMNCITKLSQTSESREKGFLGHQFRSDSYEAALSMNNERHKMVSIVYDEVATIVYILRNHTKFCRSNADVDKLAKLICYLHEGYASSSRTIRQYGTFLDIGEGLFPLFTLINHSCSGNVIWYNYKETYRVVRAAKDIQSGEQIFYDYLYPDGPSLTVKQRKEVLLCVWGIDCTCNVCTHNYVFMPEIHHKLQIPTTIRQRLKQNLIDLDAMWELFRVIYESISRPCMEVKLMKIALSMAHMGVKMDGLRKMYQVLGVF